VTNELSKKARNEKCQKRKDYAAFLNLMDKLGFPADLKRGMKEAARPYLRLIEEDLSPTGEFDNVEEDVGRELTVDANFENEDQLSTLEGSVLTVDSDDESDRQLSTDNRDTGE
jgi:hypothetical protein